MIKKIERIQVERLWRRYAKHRAEIAEKTKKERKEIEKFLFHGTKGTNPSNVYLSEEGFDLRFSNCNCLWGRGIYFSNTASYSQDYAHQTTQGRQLLLAYVITGQSVTLPQNKALIAPPFLTTNVRYDSVTNGTNIYVVYTNYKAYPAYIITY